MSDEAVTAPKPTALVLAASSKGRDHPVAKLQGKTHKCLVTIDGTAMIERVIQTLIDSKCFDRILISIENQALLEALPDAPEWLRDGIIEVLPSAGNLADSVISVSERVEAPLPMVVTTGDNALHTAELVRSFVEAFTHGTGDGAVAVTREEVVRDAYPEGKFGFFQFKDGGYSFCNLYGIRTTAALSAARLFRTGGQFRKHPWRILRIFGVLPLLLYKWRLLNLDQFMGRATRKLGITMDAVLLPYAFAPIDVDNPTTFQFCQQVLEQRRGEC